MREVIIIDGYNYLKVSQGHADMSRELFEEERSRFISNLGSVGGVSNSEIVVVFDGRRAEMPGNDREVRAGITILYSGKHDTADDVIEKLAVKKLSEGFHVTVVSSDAALQRTVFRQGINRKSVREFASDLTDTGKSIQTSHTRSRHDPLENKLSAESRAALEKIRLGKSETDDKS